MGFAALNPTETPASHISRTCIHSFPRTKENDRAFEMLASDINTGGLL